MTADPPENFGKGAAIAAAGTALSRITGFLRLAAMAYALGVAESRVADTYSLANSTPNIVFELIIGGVLSSVLMREYIEVRETEGQQEAALFIKRVMLVTMLILGVFTLIGILAAPLVLKAYTFRSGHPDVQLQRSVGTFLLRMFVPQIMFYGMSYISNAVLNAHRRFGPPMFAPALNNLLVAATFVLVVISFPDQTKDLSSLTTPALLLLGLGTTAGVAALGLAPWISMKRVLGQVPRVTGLKDPRFSRLLRRSSYMVGYVITNQLGLWVALVLAARIQGGVAGYQSAFVFFQLPHGLLAVSVATAIFPRMAESAVRREHVRFALDVAQGLRAIAFFVLPAIAGYIALGPEIIKLLLEHGSATAQSTELIANILKYWAGGILFFSSFYLVLRAFYALGDTRTPMLINLGAFAINVVLDIALFTLFSEPSMKIAGLAIGHAVSYAFAFGAGLVVLRKRVGGSASQGLASTTGRALMASAATGVAAWWIHRALGSWMTSAALTTQILRIAGATLGGLLLYASAAKLLRLEEVGWISRLIPRRS